MRSVAVDEAVLVEAAAVDGGGEVLADAGGGGVWGAGEGLGMALAGGEIVEVI